MAIKPSERSAGGLVCQSAEDIIKSHLAALFKRLPMLCGFALQHDLEVTDVTVYSWPSYTAGQDVYDDLMQGLVEIAEERPDVPLLMRGRTFARMIH